MKHIFTYNDFLFEQKFTVGGTISNRIILFDVDDTLLHSDIHVNVVKDGNVVRSLSSSEFNTDKLKQGEEYDYSEFRSLDALRKNHTFTKYWETLKREYGKGTHIGILTARSNRSIFKPFFLENGVNIKDDLIFAVCDPTSPYKGSIDERKAQAIESLILLGYRLFIFFDDNEENLKSVKKLEKIYPNIKIKTVHV